MNSTKKILIGLLILVIGGIIGYFIARGTMAPAANPAGASVYGINNGGSTGPTNPGCPTGIPCAQTIVIPSGNSAGIKDGDACLVSYVGSDGQVHYINGTWSAANKGCAPFLVGPASTNNNTKSLPASGTQTPNIKVGDPCTVSFGNNGQVATFNGQWALSSTASLYCKIAIVPMPPSANKAPSQSLIINGSTKQ